jgi:uncharacterized membrane protein YeaQ/YmgE (transglycosylase-associated protein family)
MYRVVRFKIVLCPRLSRLQQDAFRGLRDGFVLLRPVGTGLALLWHADNVSFNPSVAELPVGQRGEGAMGILGWIVFGLVVGIVAKFLMPGRDPGGIWITIALGIAGALAGGFLGRLFGWYGEGDPVGFVMAVVGAIVLLVVYRLIARPSHA